MSVGELRTWLTMAWLRLALCFDNVVRVVRSSSLFNSIPSSDRCITSSLCGDLSTYCFVSLGFDRFDCVADRPATYLCH